MKQKGQELTLIMHCITTTTRQFYGKSNSNNYWMLLKTSERTKRDNWTDF